MNFNSDTEFQIKAAPEHQSNQGEEVFFIVNIKELFNIDLDNSGIKRAINSAFMVSKSYVPMDTGLLRNSMSVLQLDSDRVKIYFDKNKIVGRKRRGVTVTEYYPIYLAEKPKTFNWLSIVMKHFYDELYNQFRKLKKQNNMADLDFIAFAHFIDAFNIEYKAKKEAAKELRDQQRMKQKLLADEIKRRKRLKNQSIADIEEE